MDIKLGEFEYVERHKGCKHGGKIMRCKPQQIDGEKFPETMPDSWKWCSGKTWIPPDPDNPQKPCNYFEYCGYRK